MTIYKASAVGDQVIPDLLIEATESAPEPNLDNWRENLVDRWESQSEEIADRLFASLPQGTLDRLVAAMLWRRASLAKIGYTLPKENTGE